MTTATQSLTSIDSSSRQEATLHRSTAMLLTIEAVLLFVPLIILGATIDWPASLDEPASVNLPLILEQHTGMIAGYSVYLVYSLLFWPVAYLTGRIIVQHDTENVLFRIASGFAVLSALARALGIVRWLFAMPVLARLYTDPAASAATQANIAAIYDMLNAYAGGIGELLGVNLFAAIWLVLIGMIVLRKAEWPNWLAYFGFVTAAASSLNLLEIIDIDMGPMISISSALMQLWLLAMAFRVWRMAPTQFDR